MAESLVLFESVINLRWFLRTSIILFLNKIDVFKTKLPKVLHIYLSPPLLTSRSFRFPWTDSSLNTPVASPSTYPFPDPHVPARKMLWSSRVRRHTPPRSPRSGAEGCCGHPESAPHPPIPQRPHTRPRSHPHLQYRCRRLPMRVGQDSSGLFRRTWVPHRLRSSHMALKQIAKTAHSPCVKTTRAVW